MEDRRVGGELQEDQRGMGGGKTAAGNEWKGDMTGVFTGGADREKRGGGGARQ